MVSLTRILIALLLTGCAGVCSSALCQTKIPKKPTATITGKVTIKGKPAPGVIVTMRLSDPGSPFPPSYKATTDEDGKYHLREIPAGSYQVVPMAPAYIASGGSSRVQMVVLNDGETVDGIDFAITRGGVITGKVTDADGHPVVEQRVSLVVADPPPNQRGLVYPITNAMTDDRGIYRIYGINAGRYKVVSGQGGDSPYFNPSSGRVSYKQTFAPDVTDPAKATVVDVTDGSEVSNIDIAMGHANQTFAANGRVVDGENNQPLPNIRVGLQLLVAGQSGSFTNSTATTNNAGEFKIENIAAGKYGVLILPQRDSDVRADPVPFEVVDQDVTGLLVKTSTGSSVAGTVVVENTDDGSVLARLVHLQVLGYVRNNSQMGSMGHSATINADGTFILKGMETGTAVLSIGAVQDRTAMKGFTLARVEHDGAVQPRGFEIKKGDQITGVRLVLNYGNATVRGVVQVENGSVPAGGRLVVRVTKTGEPTAVLRAPQLDARGHFIMEGLAAGSYDFVASIVIPNPTKARLPRVSQHLTVADGAVSDVTLVLDLSTMPGPVRP